MAKVELSDGQIIHIASGHARYTRLTFDDAGQQLAFLAGSNNGTVRPEYSLYYAASLESHAEEIVSGRTLRDAGKYVASDSEVAFAGNGNVVKFAISVGSSVAVSGRQPYLDIWRWNDGVIPPQRKAETWFAKSTGYLALYHIPRRLMVQLASNNTPFVMLTTDAKNAIGIDQSPYEVEKGWGRLAADLYFIDTETGAARLFRREYRTNEYLPFRPFKMSPTGRYIMFFEKGHWFSFDFRENKLTKLTADLPNDVVFTVNNLNMTEPRMPIGIAGWTEQDERVLLYDTHDIWVIDPEGQSSAYNLTYAMGRKENIVFRVWPADWRAGIGGILGPSEVITKKQTLLLTSRNNDTMATGIWRVRLNSLSEPSPLLVLNKKVSLIAASKHGRMYLVSQEKFDEPGDLWVGSELKQLEKITDINPRADGYDWGSAKLVKWTSAFGVPLKGIVYMPNVPKPRSGYPAVVHVYGKMTSGYHSYNPPSPHHSAYIHSPAMYTSRGYLVFEPDTLSLINHSNEDALSSVVPGVRSLVVRGLVNLDRMAITGHSAGAHKVLFIVSRTNMFRCAVESAGASNLLTNYSKISPSGLVGAFYYERSIFSASPWEDRLLYLQNSPALSADKINTPLLILHNDDDVEVPFSQGVEMFFGLRRNRKETYMISYKGEGHNLHDSNNQADWSVRMQQFLDYCLIDKPRPSWMREVAIHDKN